MLVDMPGSPRWAARYRNTIRLYFRFLSRLTMKSLFILFLGCLLSCVLTPASRSGLGLIAASAAAAFVSLAAAAGLLIAARKSLRLEKVRRSILLSSKGQFIDVYSKYAISDPGHGLQLEEFNRMSADFTKGRLQFSLTDLGIIYNALDEHQKSAINEREFAQWMTGTPHNLHSNQPLNSYLCS